MFLTVPAGFALIMKLIWPAVLSNQSINQSVQPTKSWQNNRSSHKTQPLLPVICGQTIIWNFLDIISFCVTVNLIWIYVSGRSILLTRSGSWGNNCFPYLNTVLCVQQLSKTLKKHIVRKLESTFETKYYSYISDCDDIVN